jgi:ubiquitin carboxyl-terminal hydrolase 14
MVTHKGPSAEAGHYIGWVRKDDGFVPSGEEEWYKFDGKPTHDASVADSEDDKVSVVAADKIQAMDGGGEDSVAYILLYR